MARIEQLDLLNEVVISHDDDDDGKLWFTIITARMVSCVRWRIYCTFDEAKQIYGIIIGSLLQMAKVEKYAFWKDVCISLYRGKIMDATPEDSVAGCQLLDARDIFNQHFHTELKTPAFDPLGVNEFDTEDE
jgi:hypothetical protein